ncbi:amino-acid N-acetyltransferase [Brevibacterium sp. 5221]|uniref:Amino-acid N-acetyltransferase n=2 Tax=Brevibacterium TaxID=1696 RepID=A0A6N9H9N6_9MICO|nr:amino-acid N-acetyltransferase [Brevibacterium rongguiense]
MSAPDATPASAPAAAAPGGPVDASSTASAAHFSLRSLPSGLHMRRARTADVAQIRALVEPLIRQRILTPKEQVNYYEFLQEYQLVVDVLPDGSERVVGCAALHVLWDDLAEARTVATDPTYRRRGIGRALIEQLIADARAIGVTRLFCLTFETRFFGSLGFAEISGTPVSPDVYVELLRSHDEGTAEFLDLARVKPNTLGNTRMLKHL